MKTIDLGKVVFLLFIAVLSGCANNIADPDKYSGYIGDYSNLEEYKTASGTDVLRWVALGFSIEKYDDIYFNDIVYYPEPKPSTQVGKEVLDKLLSYSNIKIKDAISKWKKLTATPGDKSLIFKGAITGVNASQQGLQFYEVVPVALLVASTQMMTGHRTMDTSLFLEGELIDAKTNKVVLKFVRKQSGNNIKNENTPVKLQDFRNAFNKITYDIEKMNI